MKTLSFYYDLVCPYAYLASTQVEAVAGRAGAAVEWKPILLGGVLKALWPDGQPFSNPSKARLGLLDLSRWAEHWGAELRFPAGHPRRTVDAMRLLLAAGERRRDLSHALYRAYWIEGRDVADRDVLREVAGDELVSRLDEPEVKEGLRAASDEALAMGVFGVPTFLVDDQLFWGQDRLAFVEKALSGWRVAA